MTLVSSWKCKVHADIREGFSWRGRQMRVGLTTTAIFGDLSVYFFGNFRDKASNIIWRYAASCRPVIDCKMNDLQWPWAAMSTNWQYSRCYIFVSFGSNVDIGLHYDIMITIRSGFRLTPIRMTLNDLERPIHLKVRLADGTLDVYVCCGFQTWQWGIERRYFRFDQFKNGGRRPFWKFQMAIFLQRIIRFTLCMYINGRWKDRWHIWD